MPNTINDAIQAYDEIASLYADYNFPKLLQFQLNKFISLLVGKKILDAGCGPGRDLQYFNEEGLDVTGIDISKGMLRECKRRAGIMGLQMDMRKMSFQDNMFDGIWCMSSLSDIPREDSEKTINEFYRILKRGGVVYIAVKSGDGTEIIKKKKYNDMPRVYVYYKQHELEGLLKKKFVIISSNTINDQGTSWVEVFAKKI
ncbi:MAG: Methyltransferase protein [archaeon GW2011_AR20]|nr:MAG: Methyltransferase protein [archaeon GW2011_AR20]MBS3160242.1 class I SAM-dependent methyltransferase [Candidatus Woesearchaeota archaeon]